MGRHRVKQATAYSRYIDKGGRIVAVRIPPEMAHEFEERTAKRGLTATAYIKIALYWYMKEEALEEQLNQLVTDDERPVGTAES